MPSNEQGTAARRYIHLFLIALIVLAIYSNTLQSPFLWDERVFIRDNPITHDLSYYRWPSKAEGKPFYPLLKRRYVGYLSFALNHRLHGYDVAGYHVFNIAVHTISAWLLYALTLLALGSTRISQALPPRRREYAALLASAIFASHPVQTEAVTYIFQRLASLSAMFYLMSVLLYAYASRTRGKGVSAAIYSASLLAAILAMKTKESAFTLPFALALFELSFNNGDLRQRALRLMPFVPLLLVVPLSLPAGKAGIADTMGHYLSLNASQDSYSAYEYLVTQFRVVVTYIRMLFLPFGQNLDHDYPLIKSIIDPGALASLVLILTLVLSSILAIKKYRNGGAWVLGPAGFGVLWFFLALSVESSIIPIPMLMNEYRMYLPSAGMALAVASLLLWAWQRSPGRPVKMIIVLSVSLPLILGTMAYKRNSVWASRVNLWEDVVAKSPLKLRGYNNLGNAYADSGQEQKAIEAYQHALPPAISNRASTQEKAELHYNLANAYVRAGNHEGAILNFGEAISLSPGNADAHNNLGLSLYATGRYQDAVASYRNALGAQSGYINAYFNLGEAYLAMYRNGGKSDRSLLDKSIRNYETFAALRPDYPDTYRELARAYSEKGSRLKAEEYTRIYKTLSSSQK